MQNFHIIQGNEPIGSSPMAINLEKIDYICSVNVCKISGKGYIKISISGNEIKIVFASEKDAVDALDRLFQDIEEL